MGMYYTIKYYTHQDEPGKHRLVPVTLIAFDLLYGLLFDPEPLCHLGKLDIRSSKVQIYMEMGLCRRSICQYIDNLRVRPYFDFKRNALAFTAQADGIHKADGKH